MSKSKFKVFLQKKSAQPFANGIARDVFGAVSTSGLILLFGKLIQLYLFFKLAIIMEPTSFTFLVSSLAIAQIFGLISVPGGQQGLTATITKSLAKKEYDICKSILLYSLFFYLCINSLLFFISIVSFNVSSWISNILEIEFLFVIFLTVFSIYRTSITRGFGYIFRSMFYLEVAAPLSLLIIIETIILDFSRLSVPVLWILIYGFYEIVTVFICKKPLHLIAQKSSNSINFPCGEFKESSQIQIANIFRLIITRIDLVILSFLTGPHLTAPYALVHRFVQPITIFGRVLSNSTAPMLAKMYSQGRNDDFDQVKRLSNLFIFLGVFLSAFFVLFFFEFFSSLLESKYELNSNVLICLIISQVVLVLSAPFVQSLLMTNKSIVIIKANFISCLIFLLLAAGKGSEINAELISKYVLIATTSMLILTIFFSVKENSN